MTVIDGLVPLPASLVGSTSQLVGSNKVRGMASGPANALTAMSSPPALSLSSSATPGTLTKNIPWNDPVFRDSVPTINNGSGQAVPQAPIQADGTTRAGAWDGPWRREFDFDGQVFSFRVASNATRKIRIWVNEQPHAAGLVAISSLTGYTGSGGQNLNVDLGSRAPRRIMIESEDQTAAANFGTLQVDPRDVVSAPQVPSPRLFCMADSYGKGFVASQFAYSFIAQMGRMLGIADTWHYSSQPSTGLVKTAAPYGNYQSRVAADVLPNLPTSKAALIIFGSLNDSGLSGIDTALTTLVTTIKAARPNVPIVVTSPLFMGAPPAGYTTVRDTMASTVTALGAQVAGFVDLLTYTGTGKVGATTGNGPADFLLANDGIHPSDAGHYSLAWQAATKIAPLLGLSI